MTRAEQVTINRTGRVAVVSFNTGHRANALSLDLMRELTAAARSFEGDAVTSAVILTGRRDVFSMGFDLRDAQALRDAPLPEQRVALQTGARLCAAWEAVAPLTICAAEGFCIGGGVALAVACDLRVIGETVRPSLPEIARGLNMSWGSVPRITALVGPARAKRLILLAEELSAAQAQHWGLADAVAPDGTVLAAAHELAQKAAAQPPVALRMGKSSINAYAAALSGAVAHADADQFALALSGEDAQSAIDDFFKRRDALAKPD